MEHLSQEEWLEPVRIPKHRRMTYGVEYRHRHSGGWTPVEQQTTVTFEKTCGYYRAGDQVTNPLNGWIYESDARHWAELRSRAAAETFYRVVGTTRVRWGYYREQEIPLMRGGGAVNDIIWCECLCRYVSAPCGQPSCSCRHFNNLYTASTQEGDEPMPDDLKVNVNREKLIETLEERKNQLESDTSLPDNVQKLVDEMKAAAEKIEGGEEVSTDKDCGPLKQFWVAWETLRHDPYYTQAKQRRKQQVEKIDRYLKIFGISDDESIEISGDDDLYQLL